MRWRKKPAWLCGAMLLGLIHGEAAASPGLPDHDGPVFERHIRPILKAHCFDCHGEGENLRGGLDLRLRRFMIEGGDSGPAIIPGRADSSPLFNAVVSGEMPKRDRKPTQAEIELLRRWIDDGAPTARPEPESLPPGMVITAEEASHWAFQPITKPAVPDLTHPPDSPNRRTPIDAFIEARLNEADLTLSEEADRATLIRRATFDLWGIPPTPAEVEAFVADSRPDAYERLIDRLLASPRYGERWGRHWLDVAGYADSDGYTNDDTPRLHAYKYRDYVIQAFNRDLALDQFILEQLAGDELAIAAHGSVEKAALDEQGREWLIATGFLRMAADGTASGGVDQNAARNQVVADTLKIVSSSLLGLSVGCAQCHDHRYDPIPQTDYYKLRAVFEPAYDWKNWRKPSERRVSLHTPADRKRAEEIEAQAAVMLKEKKARQEEFIDAALKAHLMTFPEELREPLWTAAKTPADQRSEKQKKLLGDHPSANIHPGVLYQYNAKAAEELKTMDARIAELRATKPPEDFVSALWESTAELPVTYRFHRGDPEQPREAIQPGTLMVLGREGRDPGLAPGHASAGTVEPGAIGGKSSGRRSEFARWVTSAGNPLLPRLIVNRVWMHHFGRGLVGTPGDFGLQGEHPSHPELLEWLASTFTLPAGDWEGDATSEGAGLGWSFKRLHRLIMTSATYRQSAARRADGEAADPENRLYWRRNLQRLDAEALRDALLAVTGVMSPRMYGTPVPVREDAVGQIVVGIDKKEGDNKMPVDVPMGEEEFRRSIYVEVRRSRPLAFLNAFDAPVMEVNCEQRQASTGAPQSLMLMNSAFILQQARLFAERLKRETGDERAPRVERAWHLAFGRQPTEKELGLALQFLERQVTYALAPASDAAGDAATASGSKPDAAKPADTANSSNSSNSSNPANPAQPMERAEAEELALRSLCQNLLSSNEFLYVD